jgi:hypothetical protein
MMFYVILVNKTVHESTSPEFQYPANQDIWILQGFQRKVSTNIVNDCSKIRNFTVLITFSLTQNHTLFHRRSSFDL